MDPEVLSMKAFFCVKIQGFLGNEAMNKRQPSLG